MASRKRNQGRPPGRPIFDSSDRRPADREDPALNQPRRLRPEQQVAAAAQPDVELQNLFRVSNPGSLPVGLLPLDPGWILTQRDQHLLAVAPPQSYAGKTASILIPQIIAHPGPVVVATTKPDILPATAMVRAQAGNLWCYAPDGDTSHLPPGIRELRWSPISGAANWDLAIKTARSMTTATTEPDGMRGGAHWRERAGALLAPVFHWAAICGGGMAEVQAAVYGHRERLRSVYEGLRDRGAVSAAAMLQSILDAGTEERASIASTAGRALQVYSLTSAMRSTENPNFDPADFVNGGTWPVRADTIYITAMSGDQQDVAPLVVGLVTQIQEAAFRRHRNLVAKSLLGESGSGPILLALDELHNLAPLPRLPALLSEGGSQGILITAAVQSLTLLKARWPDTAESFFTLFRHVLIFPGVRDPGTNRQVSEQLGHEEVRKTTETRKSSTDGVDHITQGTEWRLRYTVEQVAAGPSPWDQDCVFHFAPYGHDILRMTPYWRAAPWPHVLTAYLERSLRGRVPEWRWDEALVSQSNKPDLEDLLPALPVPRLGTWATWALENEHGPRPWDRAWAQRFLRAVEDRDAILRSGPRAARWDIHQPKAAMWCVTHYEALLPTSPIAAQPEVTGPSPAEGQPQRQPTPTAPPPPVPMTNFPFEAAAWTAEDEAVMRANPPGQPTPRWIELQGRIENAILAEATRRMRAGEREPVIRFLRGRSLWGCEFERNPDFRAQCIQEASAATRRGEEWGFWKWIPPIHARAFLAFLRGEPTDEAYARGPASPIPPPRLFSFEEAWGLEDDVAMYLRSHLGGAYPPGWDQVWEHIRTAITAEKERRTAQGDTASIAWFEAEGTRLTKRWEETGPAEADPTSEIGQRGGFWRWIDPALAAVLVAFLRGEPLGAPAGAVPIIAMVIATHDEGRADPPTPPAGLPASPPPQRAATAGGPSPECWEPEWGPEDTAAMEAWDGRNPMPDGYARAFAAMEAAIRRESARRRQLDDDASADWYTRERERLTAELGEPEVEEEWQRKMEEARARGTLGYWDWFSPPISRLTRAFLRGEGCRPAS